MTPPHYADKAIIIVFVIFVTEMFLLFDYEPGSEWSRRNERLSPACQIRNDKPLNKKQPPKTAGGVHGAPDVTSPFAPVTIGE